MASTARRSVRRRATTARGAFLKGVWHCECEPRQPAEKHRVKKEGKNQGKWFYTCQNAADTRCGFFIWADDAKVREESAVLSNSRSEPHVQQDGRPATPPRNYFQSRAQQQDQPPIPTPPSKMKSINPNNKSPSKRALPEEDDDDDDYGWSSGADEDLVKASTQLFSKGNSTMQTPSKASRTMINTSPSRRLLSDESLSSQPNSKPSDTFNIYTITTTNPTLSHNTNTNGLPSPLTTPSKPLSSLPPQPQSLLHQSQLLLSQSPTPISQETQTSLIDLMNRFELRSLAATKARDITRVALQARDRKITELQEKIQALETEKETLKVVVGHLKADMALAVAATGKKRVGKQRNSSTLEDSSI